MLYGYGTCFHEHCRKECHSFLLHSIQFMFLDLNLCRHGRSSSVDVIELGPLLRHQEMCGELSLQVLSQAFFSQLGLLLYLIGMGEKSLGDRLIV